MITEAQLIAIWSAIQGGKALTCRGLLEAAQSVGVTVVSGNPIKPKPPFPGPTG